MQNDHPPSPPTISTCPAQQGSESPNTTEQRVNNSSEQGKLNNVDKTMENVMNSQDMYKFVLIENARPH